MEINSVLTFYEVSESSAIDEKTVAADEVFDQIMSLDSSKRVCKNVYKFSTSPDQLVTQLENPSGCSKVLVDNIAKELECGATHMFVQPVIGRPVYASPIREFLDKARLTPDLSKESEADVAASSKQPAKSIRSKYFDIDSWSSTGVNVPNWAFKYLYANNYLGVFQAVFKARRHEFLPVYRERTQDMKLDCLMFNKRGQLAFKWNSEQDKMAFILKWS